jgi:hypothetical protein
MTMAMCMKCGAEKFGAWVGCPKCGFVPATDVERAKSIALSDHHLSKEDLLQAGATIASGQEIKFEGEGFENIVRSMHGLEERFERIRRRFRLILIAVVVLVVVGIVALIVYLIW